MGSNYSPPSSSGGVKLYTTVSASGTDHNGNVTDYGPHTPGTTTVGIQEAINAVVAQGGGRIFMFDGTYSLASDVNVGCSSGVSASTPPTTPIGLEIVGESAVPALSQYVGYPSEGVIIKSAAPTTNAANSIVSFEGSSINLTLENIVVEQPIGSNMWHAFALGVVGALNVKNCAAWQDSYPTTAPGGIGGGSEPYAAGFFVDDGPYHTVMENCNVSGFPSGFNVSAHTKLIGCGAGYCKSAINVSSNSGNRDHPVRLIGFGAQQCVEYITTQYFSNESSIIIIGDMEIEWTAPGGGTFSIANFVYDPTNVLAGKLYVTGHASGPSPPPAIIPLATLNNNGGQNLILEQIGPLGFDVTTPAVPTGTGSANAVTNTLSLPVRVYQTGESGTHIIDRWGTDKALPADSADFLLDAGAKVYYATTVPSSWLWYGA